MSESIARAAPVAVQTSVAQALETKGAPEKVEEQSTQLDQHLSSAAGSSSPQTPPSSYGALFNHLQNSSQASTARTALFRRLQSVYGNSYVNQVIQRSPDPDADDESTPDADADSVTGQANVAEGSIAEASGEVEVTTGSTEAIEGEPLEGATGCDKSEASATGQGQAAVTPQGNRQLRLDARFELDSGVMQAEPLGGEIGAADMVEGSFTFTSKVTTGQVNIPDSAHGYAEPTFDFGKAKWEKKAFVNWIVSDLVTVTAPLTLECRWNVQSLGKERIFTAEDDAVSMYSWASIVRDLTPDATGKPPRGLYYVPHITKDHELFHCTDYINRAKAYVPKAEDWFRTQTINIGSDAEIDTQVADLLKGAKKQFETDLQFYLKNGGEERAYGAGKGDYEKLVSAIKQRAAANQWPEPKDAKPKGSAPKTP
ncbi:MAG: hypothetical protein H7Y30_06875 [Pyrinomonadaceae bacterium]|nr:hypothetical protein [Pyrinomonadaceae bacterium]